MMKEPFMKRIYLDYAATTPTDPDVIKAMEPYLFEQFGNASSLHAFGQAARKAVEDSRQIISRFIGAQPDEIVFTSGGTESNNHAVLGAAKARSHQGKHIILAKTEHHSVIEPVHQLEKEGFKVTWMDVDKT